jgi:translocation and assembly module TamB
MLAAGRNPGMIAGVKRKVALAFVAAVLAVAGGAVLALRTAWAGERLCALAAERVRAATGLPLALAECRVEPFHLEVSARDVRLGPPDAPLFAAEAVRARLAPVQALGRRLELAELAVTRPRVTVRLPPARPGEPASPCPPPALQRFEVHSLEIEDGAVDLTFPGGQRVRVGRVDVRAVPAAARRGIAALAAPGVRRAGLDVALSRARVELGDRRIAVDEASVAADLALDLSRLDLHLASAELPGVSVAAAGTIENLCRPRLDLGASLRGDVPALLALLGSAGVPSEGRVSMDVAVTGPAERPVIEGDVRLAGVSVDGRRAGDASAQLRFAGAELRVERLELPTLGGRVAARGTVRFGREVALAAEAALEGVELGEVFSRLGLPGAWVMARLTGKARVSGTAWPLQLTGEAGIDLVDFRVLGHGWEGYRRGEAAFLDLRRARVDGNVRVDRAGVRIEAAQARAGQATLATRGMLHFDGERGFDIACEGAVDLGELRHLGPVPVGGLARVDGVVVRAAPYGNPHAEGRARVSGLRFLELDLGEATAGLSYDAFVLHVLGVQGRRGATPYQGEVAVDLQKDPPLVTDARWAAQGRLRDLFEAAMPWQPNAVYARDALDGDVVVQGTARGPAPALEATFEGELGHGELRGRAFDAGRFSGRVEEGARAVFDRAELRRGSGVARGSGRVGFERPFPWDLEASVAGVRLADLGLPGTGWTGTFSGTAALGGSWEVPLVKFAGNGEGVGVFDAPIGSVQLGGRLSGTALSMTGSTEGARLTATARTTGDMPFEANVDLDVEDVTRFVPGGPPAGLRARVKGVGRARGVLTDPGAAHARLELDEVHGGYGEFKVDNAAPAVFVVEDRRVVVQSFTLRGGATQFAVTGAREPSGALALDARGKLDLRLLGGLLPGVTEPLGTLLLEAHVGGTAGDPLLVGTGKLSDVGFHVRGVPIVFTGMSGDLAFSQNRMLFDRLGATVNGGGRAELAGEVELVKLFPARVRVGAAVDEVSVHIPEWLPSIVSGRLQAAGTWDAMLLSGKLHVLQARYTDRVDLEKRVLEVPRKKPPPRPFDKAGEWLAFDIALVVDGDARIENDLVRGALSGDLTLTGTLASVGLIGTLTMTEGSRGTFRGNEFVLTHAVVDFADRRNVRMSLDVHGDAQVRDYQVFMHLFGPYEEPTLQLTSQPALSQQDIVTLLSLGYTTRDTAAAAGVTGLATAAAAQALFSASGLDDQVKRFVPRGRLLRDFSVRITSAYSEGAGQVEPRAEFESKVLDERFRLRYQAPLAGSRGQRAQAEMRLSPHTSLQYQWDNDSPDVASGGDHGLDLKLRWEWTD